ncbi:hypothetical protein M9H77_30485 [Catharanthus roseus]|uniref:Uncharacterized protein n=1 Tax=Catharanthus roseus TaxID=4058 RepID=A0ACB9ZZN4_CATRO|nr:hypothetical protein M9H77_30485 [Catharanthus roseus]
MGVRLFCNRAFVWCLAGINCEMPELRSDGLVLGIRTLSGVEAALMCLDSLRLPSCARNPHELFRETTHCHCFKEITTAPTHEDSLSISSGRSRAQQATKCQEARRCPTQPQLT